MSGFLTTKMGILAELVIQKVTKLLKPMSVYERLSASNAHE